MNQKIKKLDIQKILFWDLECVRAQENLTPDTEEYNLYEHKTRNKETDAVLTQSEVIAHYKNKGALSLTHNKIVCISMGFVSEDKIYLKSITGEQKDIIREFSSVLNKGLIPCGWNIVGFDFPVLRQKAFQEGILDYAPEQFNDAGKKEWAFTEVKYDINVIDLMLLFRGTHFHNQSLAEACYLAGLPSPKNDNIEGSKVSEVYYKEGVKRIKKYCEGDVLSCIHLLQKMKGEKLITDIIYKNEKLEIKELPLLEKLYQSKNFSEDIKSQLEETLSKKKLTKKDKEIILDLIRASLCDIDPNFGKVKNETEVNKIIEQLRC